MHRDREIKLISAERKDCPEVLLPRFGAIVWGLSRGWEDRFFKEADAWCEAWRPRQCCLSLVRTSQREKVAGVNSHFERKAEKFVTAFGIEDFHCSNGWIDCFKQWHDLKFRTVSGKRGSKSWDDQQLTQRCLSQTDWRIPARRHLHCWWNFSYP